MGELQAATVAALIARSLDSDFEADDEEDCARAAASAASWAAVSALAARADEEVFAAARELLLSGDPWHRARGAEILGDFAGGAMRQERLSLFSSALDSEADERVLVSLILATGHLYEPSNAAPFVALAGRANREVRRAIAMVLQADWGATSVAALCRLCTDECSEVREWAAFEFGFSDVDTQEIRECLRLLLNDEAPEVRAEAIRALARRRDLSCLESLVSDLGKLEQWDDLASHLEAARCLLNSSVKDKRTPQELRGELIRRFGPLAGSE